MKREELKRYTSSEIEEIDDALLEASEDGTIKMTRVYIASEANSVMDAMEKQIRILENDKEEMYDANLVLQDSIKELENKNKNLQYSSDMWMACCKLMSEGKRNVMSSDALAEMQRIKELEAENARLKAQAPKWISVKDRLPYAMELVLAITTKKTFAPVTYSPLTNSWIEHGLLLGTITHWMPLPPSPTEESSATEMEK